MNKEGSMSEYVFLLFFPLKISDYELKYSGLKFWRYLKGIKYTPASSWE